MRTSEPRLSNRTMSGLPSSVKVPAYDRSRITTGIAHLGIGAFHRAHQAAYTDAVLTSGSNEWGIVGVSLRRPDTRDALQIQDELYTLAIRDGDSEKLQVIGSIQNILVAPEDPASRSGYHEPPGHPHCFIDNHRKGLLPRCGGERAGPVSSRYYL